MLCFDGQPYYLICMANLDTVYQIDSTNYGVGTFS